MATPPVTNPRRTPVLEIALLVGLQLLAVLACGITIAVAVNSGFTPLESATAKTAHSDGP